MSRRLAAVLAADMVGFSAQMARDEAGTLARLIAFRKTVFDPHVRAHGGRIVKLMGDGALVEFPSVVDAVACAVAVQSAEKDPEDPGIRLRIGVSLGDVIATGRDIYGAGVNVAARARGAGRPGRHLHLGPGAREPRHPAGRGLRGCRPPPAEEHRHPGPGVPLATGRRREPWRLLRPGPGQAVHRSPGLRQHVDRSRAGVFLGRDRRGHHHRPVAFPRILRHRPQHQLHLQGTADPGRRGLPRARGALSAGRVGAQGRTPRPGHRAADRRGDRRAYLGGAP
ncbi:MAG: adenylate/guanylate cyclase domain-containing protein [Sedimentitalea sp.]|nr:adenylate/guanylate cyclase domain-containing protein [Sedimentitalea sp.]